MSSFLTKPDISRENRLSRKVVLSFKLDGAELSHPMRVVISIEGLKIPSLGGRDPIRVRRCGRRAHCKRRVLWKAHAARALLGISEAANEQASKLASSHAWVHLRAIDGSTAGALGACPAVREEVSHRFSRHRPIFGGAQAAD